MSQATSVLAAVGASTCAAVAATLQARTAARTDQPPQSGAKGLLRFARSQLSRRAWWGSLVVQAVGFTLHATALRSGALALVQPLMAAAVVLALPLSSAVNRIRVTWGELGWAGLLTAGVAGLLLSSGTRPRAGPVPSAAAIGLALVVALVGIAACVTAARRVAAVAAAALLGSAASVAFAAEAVLLQRVAGVVAAGPGAVLGSAAAYGLVLAGATGVACTQLAYRAGPMSAALPAIVLVNPLLSVAFGVLVQHDSFRHSPVAVVVEGLSLAMLVIGALALTRGPLAVRSAP